MLHLAISLMQRVFEHLNLAQDLESSSNVQATQFENKYSVCRYIPHFSHKAKRAHLFRPKFFSSLCMRTLPARAVCFFLRMRQISLSVVGFSF